MIKEGDTRNAIRATLTKNGEVMDLTDCNVYISVSDKVYEDICNIEDAKNGKVFYPLSMKVSSSSGFYKYEFIVKYKDGREETFPNDKYLELRVMTEVKG